MCLRVYVGTPHESTRETTTDALRSDGFHFVERELVLVSAPEEDAT